MQFKDFLQWIRATGERYIVLGHDGEPEFVIEPFTKKQQPKLSLDTETVNDAIAETSGKEREELSGWDAMADTTLGVPRAPSVGADSVGPRPDVSEEEKNDEPRFQFETIDE